MASVAVVWRGKENRQKAHAGFSARAFARGIKLDAEFMQRLFDRQICRSTGRLAAASDADFFPKAIEADRADHDLLAYHIAPRAVHAHRFGELEVFLKRGAHFRTRDILLDPRDIEAGVLGGRHRTCLIGLAAAAEQLLMKVEIFLAG